MQATERLYLTKDGKKLVREGDPKGATLYAAPGDTIPQSAVEMFGLAGGTIKGKAGAKEDKGGSDKERKPGEDKGGAGAPPPPPPPPAADDLAKLKGVGEKTAGSLAAAGYTSFASIAAIDAANPPKVDGLGAVFKWADVVASAKELAGAPAEQAS